jgi:hypothetical protein
VALVDGLEWASAVAQGGRYVLDIPERIPATPPCFLGGRIAFRCGDLTAAESPEWASGLHQLDLTFAATKPGAAPGPHGPSEVAPGPQGPAGGAPGPQGPHGALPGAELEPHEDILLFLDVKGEQVVSASEIGAALNIDVPLVEGYLDELEPEGVVGVARTFGGYSAFITPRGKVRAHRARGGPVARGKILPARPRAAATAASLDDASQHYFVAHEFSRENRDDLRRAIEEGLADSGLTPYYADGEVRQGHIFMDKILPKIRHTRFGIYDISNPQKPNVFLELGAAIAIGKPYFVICKTGTEVPADLGGLDRIEYESYSELAEQIRAKIQMPPGGHS